MFVQRTALGEFFPASANVVPFAGVDGHVLGQVPLVLEAFATQLAHKPCPLIHTTLSGNKPGVSKILEKLTHERNHHRYIEQKRTHNKHAER